MEMTGLFMIMSGFMLNPSIENVKLSEKDKVVMNMMYEKSNVADKCHVKGVVGVNKSIVVLGIGCEDKNGDYYNGRLAIDYKNQLRMKKRFYPSNWK